jgi:hypothetical protein
LFTAFIGHLAVPVRVALGHRKFKTGHC